MDLHYKRLMDIGPKSNHVNIYVLLSIYISWIIVNSLQNTYKWTLISIFGYRLQKISHKHFCFFLLFLFTWQCCYNFRRVNFFLLRQLRMLLQYCYCALIMETQKGLTVLRLLKLIGSPKSYVKIYLGQME